MTEISKKQRNVHEKLRSDHIDMLNQLQNFQDENEQLKEEIKSLKKQLGSNCDDGNLLDDELVSKDTSPTQLLYENRALKEELQKLKDSMKRQEVEITRKVSNQMNKTIEDLTKQIYKFQKEQKDSQLQIKQLETQLHELHTAPITSTATLVCTTCEEHKQQIQQLLLQLTKLENDHQSQIKSLSSPLMTVHSSGITAEEVSQLQNKILSLEKQCVIINQQYLQSCEQISFLQTSFHNCENQLQQVEMEKKQYLSQIHLLETEIFQTIAKTDSTGQKPSTPSFWHSLESTEKIEQQQQQQVVIVPKIQANGERSNDFSLTSSSSATQQEEELMTFRFQDYLRLKRENKEMKAQIAELLLNNHSRNAHQPLIPTYTQLATNLATESQLQQQQKMMEPNSGSVKTLKSQSMSMNALNGQQALSGKFGKSSSTTKLHSK